MFSISRLHTPPPHPASPLPGLGSRCRRQPKPTRFRFQEHRFGARDPPHPSPSSLLPRASGVLLCCRAAATPTGSDRKWRVETSCAFNSCGGAPSPLQVLGAHRASTTSSDRRRECISLHFSSASDDRDLHVHHCSAGLIYWRPFMVTPGSPPPCGPCGPCGPSRGQSPVASNCCLGLKHKSAN